MNASHSIARSRLLRSVLSFVAVALVPLATITAFAAEKPLNNTDVALKNTDKPLGAEKPLPIKEVCLLLRGGYTTDEVLREVTTRRLLDSVDPAAEKQLVAAGATPAFINTLKTGNYNLPAAAAEAARQRQNALDQHEQAAHDTEQARLAADRQAVQAHQQGEADAQRMLQAAQFKQGQPLTPAKSHVMSDLLRGQLVTLRNGQFQRYDDKQLVTKKLYGIYFSASWCGPCRKVTPGLVKFYDEFVKVHPEFEMVFVCDDRSAQAMQKYMTDDQMTWPAVPFDQIKKMTGVTKYAGSGIPDLVLVDDSGQVLSDSYRNGHYVGTDPVVKDLVATVSK